MMKKMLIIDDDTDILEALEALMNMEGFEVKISTKADAINRITVTNQPDLIILDVMLSGKDGRLLCQWLKKQEMTKNIPVLMISAHPTVRSSTLKAGANDFLAKPFEIDDLVNRVNHLIN